MYRIGQKIYNIKLDVPGYKKQPAMGIIIKNNCLLLEIKWTAETNSGFINCYISKYRIRNIEKRIKEGRYILIDNMYQVSNYV